MKKKRTNGVPIDLSGFEEAVNQYLNSYLKYNIKIMKAERNAEILATEYFVCAGLGFTKYLN